KQHQIAAIVEAYQYPAQLPHANFPSRNRPAIEQCPAGSPGERTAARSSAIVREQNGQHAGRCPNRFRARQLRIGMRASKSPELALCCFYMLERKVYFAYWL